MKTKQNDPVTTDFGYEKIPVNEKTARVASVFHQVADQYDLMNDLMSLGIHRYWKWMAIALAQIKQGEQVLDVAAGSGDLSYLIANQVGEQGVVWVSDINAAMLKIGRDKLTDAGLLTNLRYVQANVECLPFPEDSFDCITIAFGLRNVTDKFAGLQSMYRCLKPGGRLIILEFSKLESATAQKIYDQYSFTVLPWLGEFVAKDRASYQYLAESIRMHPDQARLMELMYQAGFDEVTYRNLSGGIVAIHRGYKW